ncbi:MAG: hypothetical protein AAFQ10_13090 [Pseudomonadota bacterium]
MFLKALLSCLVGLAFAATPLHAQALPERLEGQWQSDLQNCGLPENQRVKGEYLTIFQKAPLDETKPGWFLGGYDTEGSACIIDDISQRNEIVEIGALCRAEESDPHRRNFRLQQALGGRYLVLEYEDGKSASLFTKCDGRHLQKSAITPAEDWRITAYCNADEPLKAFKPLDDCKVYTQTCIAGTAVNAGSCPIERVCSYGRGNETISEANCIERTGFDEEMQVQLLNWENGNRVVLTNAEGQEFTVNGQLATPRKLGKADCRFLQNSDEWFCVRDGVL